MVLAAWWRRRRVRGVVRGMVAARRRGHGVYVNEWWFPRESLAQGGAALEPMLAWLRHTLGNCRRPHGIDQFDLAIAASAGEDGRVRSTSFRDLQPALLYRDDALERRIVAFLTAATPAGAPTGEVVRVALALFSWGDAAYAALPAAG